MHIVNFFSDLRNGKKKWSLSSTIGGDEWNVELWEGDKGGLRGQNLEKGLAEEQAAREREEEGKGVSTGVGGCFKRRE